jgi:hypothetical protein
MWANGRCFKALGSIKKSKGRWRNALLTDNCKAERIPSAAVSVAMLIARRIVGGFNC